MSPLDQPPVFERRDNIYYVTENTPVGHLIVTMKANGGPDNVIRYRLVSRGYEDDSTALFQVDPITGRLIVNGLLDREVKDVFKLTILASTDSSPSLTCHHDMVIRILDANDNAPRFQSNPYKVQLSESVGRHTQVIQVVALDDDFGNNGEVVYSFGPSSKALESIFSLNPHDGWITTVMPLDYEAQTSYDLEVVAKDKGNPSQSSITHVQLEIIDDNDNPAEFSQRHYFAAVNEQAPAGNIIFQLQVEDRDKMAKTDVDFYIISGDPKGKFQVL